MKAPGCVVFISLLLGIIAGCSNLPVSSVIGTPISPPIPTPSPSPGIISPSPGPSEISPLFLETQSIGTAPTAPHVTRYRFVRVNFEWLLDANGLPRPLKLGSEITINLFPDVTYTGVIEQVNDDGGVISWTGYLKDVEYSQLTMVYTSGVFIGHFASPAGVYEVSTVGDDLYRVIQIDQQKLQGGEG